MSNYLNLKHLSYFVDIAKRKSFTKAAEDIFVSQSSLSKAVKCLEEEFDVVLIDRTNKSFCLTEEGKILLSEGEKLLQYINQCQMDIVDKVRKSARRLRVGMPPVISTAYFSYLIYKFRECYSDVNLEIIEAGANTVQNLVDRGDVDIGVVILPIVNSYQYQINPAMSSENVLIVNRKHWLASRSVVSFAELKEEKFLILDSTYMLHDKIITNCGIAGFYPNITIESSQWDFLAEMVALNQGVSILPKPIVKRFSSGENIHMLHLREPEFPWNIAMITKKEKLITEQMKDFIDLVIHYKNIK